MAEVDLAIGFASSDSFHARLEVAGCLDEGGMALLLGALHSHLDAGRRFVQLDLSRMAMVSDEALTELAHAHYLFGESKGALILAGILPEARERVWQLGLDRVLLIAPDDAALERQIA